MTEGWQVATSGTQFYYKTRLVAELVKDGVWWYAFDLREKRRPLGRQSSDLGADVNWAKKVVELWAARTLCRGCAEDRKPGPRCPFCGILYEEPKDEKDAKDDGSRDSRKP